MRSFRSWIIPILIVIAMTPIIFYGVRRHNKWKKDHILIELKAIQTPKGWGYDILTDGKVYIHQNIIPAVPGDYGFKTREDALAVGQKVYERVMAGKMPMISVEEVKELGVYPDSTKKQ